MPATERGDLLLKLASLVEEHAHVLATIETWDNGKQERNKFPDPIHPTRLATSRTHRVEGRVRLPESGTFDLNGRKRSQESHISTLFMVILQARPSV
jgi:acyl-CoA reductase-like NAD-dependent aldehyde dehydrogenase